jgi:hypothetical protein
MVRVVVRSGFVQDRPSLDLDVLFTRVGDDYQAQVVRSPAGEGQFVRFPKPFSDLELENLILKIGRFTGRTRRVEAPPVIAAKEAGARLFNVVFAGALGECLRRSQDHAIDEQAALRIRLRLSDCLELADLPWELLYDRSEDSFLALSSNTPVVRHIQLPARTRPVAVTLPLKILVIRSEPADYPALDLDVEWAQVAEALAGLAHTGLLTVRELAVPSLGELRRELLRDTYHVLHYMGHGGFDQQRGGFLMFTDGAGRGAQVTAADLGVMLRDHSSMRLAVLNACQAGRTDPHDPFAGVADTLVRRGIPAVVAMQFEITDTAAVEFAPALYGALATGRPIDAAIAEARKAMYIVSALEWATPVLYLRADSARLFDIPGGVTGSTEPVVPASNWEKAIPLSGSHRRGLFTHCQRCGYPFGAPIRREFCNVRQACDRRLREPGYRVPKGRSQDLSIRNATISKHPELYLHLIEAPAHMPR